MVPHAEGPSGKFPVFIICRGLKEKSTSLGKQSFQTLPQKTSTNNVKVSRDHFQAEVHNSAPANTQFKERRGVGLLSESK